MIAQLPSPPKGKKGWPWTQESKPLPATMPDGSAWPKISIVTPSYNQGCYIEETIRSVLLQNYPNLEYVIIDGGSTDETVEIIKKYEPWLTYWVSEPDRGQSHAINKGFERCTGGIYNWLCSDDLFISDAFFNVALLMEHQSPFWLIGSATIINKNGLIIRKNVVSEKISMATFMKWSSNYFYQPSTFWNKKIHFSSGGINENLHYFMDVDLWYKFFKIVEPKVENVFLSSARNHENSKTSGKNQADQFMSELSIWIIENLLNVKKSELNNEVKDAFKSIQYDLNGFKRIKSHIIFKHLFAFWKKFINKNFPID